MKKLWDEYMQLVENCSVLLISPPPNIDQVYQLVLGEEQHWQLLWDATDRSRINGSSYTEKCHEEHFFKRKLNCDHCKVKGHSTDKCWKVHGFPSNKTEQPRFFCDHCKVIGHSKERCWKIHGHPPGKGPKIAAQASTSDSYPTSLTTEQYAQLMSLLNKHSNSYFISHATFITGPFDEQASCD
ncbi:hypothetical protein V2J09_010425 [Rumex salicifolius]